MARVWLNGTIVGDAQARISALDRGVLWGYGLFETMRVYGRRPWAFDRHLERLRDGADVLGIALPAEEVLASGLAETVRANDLTDCGARITVTAGAGPVDPHAGPSEAPNVMVTAWPLRDYGRLYRSGASMVTLPGWGRTLPGVKTTSYAASVAGRLAAARAGADDALFLGPDGLVLEATGSNIFAVFGEEIVTTPVSDGVLPGVTRSAVLDLAADVGLVAREEGLWLDDLFTADEVVATSTLREVYPVSAVDGRTVSRGPLADGLRGALGRAVRDALA